MNHHFTHKLSCYVLAGALAVSTPVALTQTACADDVEVITVTEEEVIFEQDGITYKATGENTVQVGDGTHAMTSVSGSVTIPSTVTYGDQTYTVTAVGDRAFLRVEALTDIQLPETITEIGQQAFFGTSIRSFVMPHSVRSIGVSCFTYTESLTTVTLSDQLEEISESAFSSSAITTIAIPDSVQKIGVNAFNGCESLQKVSIGTGVKTIGKSAFWSNTSLREVSIADGSTLETVGELAFQWCGNLASVNLPAGVKTIEKQAFASCTSLQSNGLGQDSQLENLGDGAFSSTRITGFYFPASLTTVGSRPFDSCSNLNAFAADENNSVYQTKDGVLFSKDGKQLVQYPASRNASSYEVPSGVESIGAYAFQGTASRLHEVTIGNDVAEVGGYAFQKSGVESVRFGNSVKTIGRLCFYNSDNLYSVTLPETLETLGEYTFYRCGALEELEIPAGVTEIAGSAVSGCSNLSSISILSEHVSVGNRAFTGTADQLQVRVVNEAVKNAVVESGIDEEKVTVKTDVKTVEINGVTYELLTKASAAEGATAQVTAITGSGRVEIPSTVTIGENSCKVTTIASYAMRNSAVTELNLPNTVTTLADHALADASELTAFVIPSGVTSIGVNAIAGCPKLKTIGYEANSQLESIGNGAFSDNSVLTSISIPASVKKLGTHTMFYNYQLKEVVFQEGSAITEVPSGTFMRDEALERVVLPGTVNKIAEEAFWNCKSLPQIDLAKVDEIGANAFYHCTSLTQVQLSDALEELESGTFEGCTSLNQVTLGKNLKKIGAMRSDGEEEVTGPFEGCTALKEITLPASVTLLGKNAFYECEALSRVTILSEDLDTIGANALYRIADHASIVVPTEQVKQTLITMALVDEKQITVAGAAAEQVSKIELSGLSHKIAAGKKLQLTATVLPENAEQKTLKWTSGNTKVATVSKNGRVSLKSNSGGKTVTITAEATDGSGVKATWKISSMKGQVKRLTMTGAKNVKAGKQLKLKVKVTASKGANKNVIWEVSNRKYASVSDTGVLTAKKAGKGKKVTVTAYATDGTGIKTSRRITIA